MTKQYELEWVTEVGLKAYVWRNSGLGTYCGYVDRFHVKQSLYHLGVHGGVTYEDKWLVGFDCNHVDDLPDPDTHNAYHMEGISNFPSATFKDVEFVKRECEKLAKQVNDVYCGVLACMVV